MVVHKQAS